jgi:hypothetical protein
LAAARRNLEGAYQRAFAVGAAACYPSHRLFRRNVGLIKMGGGRVFRAGVPGQADFYVIGKGGWHGEIEIKRFGKLSPDQLNWMQWCFDWKVPWILMRAEKDEAQAATISRWLEELGRWLKNR